MKKYNSYKCEITPEVANLLNRDFYADQPNIKWLTDIAKFAIPAGKVYLSPSEHPIVHTDRGSHYRWPGWIDRMNTAGLTHSMSKKGCSPDNAACEGFFGRLKNEMFYGRSWIDVSISEFIDKINEYINWYNTKRIKQSLGFLSPVEYRHTLGLSA